MSGVRHRGRLPPHDHDHAALHPGEPQTAGPLTVFSVFGPAPKLEYRDFAGSVGHGAFVKELDGGASVNDLVVGNPTDLPLLVYEGEEVLGAQQNRTFDVSALIAPHSQVHLPVSCVEQGRWDGSRHSEPLTASPQAADPSLRRRKRATANRRAEAGLEARADQREVWQEVEDRMLAHGVDSASAAMSDVYDGRRDALEEISAQLHVVNGSSGAIAFVGARPVAIDYISSPAVFAGLFHRLAQGYALDAVGATAEPADPFEAERFLHAVFEAPRHPLPTPGLGRGVRLLVPEANGSGLEHEDELVALCAFPPRPR